MPLSIKDGGVWKTPEVWVKDGGTWKKADVHVKDGGVWKLAHSNITFTPVPGNYSDSGPTVASYTVTASSAVVWTYTKSDNVSADRSSGTSGTSITFTLFGSNQFGNATLYAEGNTWSISLDTM